jgi:hypothetical protein
MPERHGKQDPSRRFGMNGKREPTHNDPAKAYRPSGGSSSFPTRSWFWLRVKSARSLPLANLLLLSRALATYG